jgi:ATPase family associated with various cellular activities (AAA)
VSILQMGRKSFRQIIHEHFGKDPTGFPIVTEQFEKYNHPNIHLALEAYTKQPGVVSNIVGIQGGFMNFAGVALSEVVSQPSVASYIGFGGAKKGPVQYANIELDRGEKIACVQSGLFLISGEHKLAVMLRQHQMDFTSTSAVYLDVMATERSIAENFMNLIRRKVNEVNIYRGKILSIAKNNDERAQTGGTGIRFHALNPTTRDKIILPDGLITRIERQTLDAGKYSKALLSAGRKLKRGILFHGKPGTGKTLTAMYLASEMKGRTVLIVTGRGLGLIETSCEIARWLEPSMVIIEDVDLVAQERSLQEQNGCSTPVLFELLNQMDGLSDDLDIMFVLTTNRPSVLEPALSARPGRVDQAFEIPLPDAECRKRLFDLYGKGLTLKVDDMDSFIRRTEGASGAFIQELFRKAALFAAPDGDPIVVKDHHLDDALHELVFVGGSLTKSLLGFSDEQSELQAELERLTDQN